MLDENIPQAKLIEIINGLAAKKKLAPLTADEEILKKEAYAIYLKRFRNNFDSQLDGVKIKDPDGKITPFKEYHKNKRKED